ncbi:hypothetical protein C4D60_Mb08t15170 [Musa balbisiana]|uniref:Uncharacterized protein n=1 Tax=Musa balbisiana TaxID=52838 RepID=A0A4S8K3X3_MUSBA|nr:hypothetical protein C4D60_Mb08t15170 [Musa balbisiana]
MKPGGHMEVTESPSSSQVPSMAADAVAVGKTTARSSRSIEEEAKPQAGASLLSSYLGLGFALFLGLLPKSSASYVSSLQSRNRILAMKLFEAEDQLRQLRSRLKEGAKANARVAEIFAGHRTQWQQEEKRLLHRIDGADEEIAALRAQVEDMERTKAELRAAVVRLEREVAERDEMLDFMARKVERDGSLSLMEVAGEDSVDDGGAGVRVSDTMPLEERFLERNGESEGMMGLLAQQNGCGREFLMAPPMDTKQWTDRWGGWPVGAQCPDMQYDSLDLARSMKHGVARRESPWRVDAESSRVSSKLKSLEDELVNLEKLGKGDASKIPSLMRKQEKRYQSLSAKIDDLCRKMRVNDPSDPTLGPEFRTQRLTEFLLEAFRLQHRAAETRQKLNTVQAEAAAAKSRVGDELTAEAKLNTRKYVDSIRSSFKEIQRNLEIWLARIMGDLEGILARDGASRARDYYLSGYPFGG